jgi:uncharacterized protein YfbU (UPF0304 family)
MFIKDNQARREMLANRNLTLKMLPKENNMTNKEESYFIVDDGDEVFMERLLAQLVEMDVG